MSYIGREPQIGNFQVCDNITVVNGQAAYTMQVGGVNVSPETANHMLVSLNGVLQAPGSSYTVSGSTITFASNLVTGDVINFIHILGSVLDLGVPSDNTVSLAKLTASGTKSSSTFLRGDNTFAAAGGGKVLQVVSNTTTTVASTTSSTYEHATNCPTLNITPAASSSKILLIASIGAVETNGTGYFTMFRDSTNIGDSGEGFGYIQPDNTTYLGGGHHVLDEPSTSSQITYQIRIKCSGGTFTIGRSESRASLTAIEIGA
jgi:hypothetical protein